jgi:hypothetical protein
VRAETQLSVILASIELNMQASLIGPINENLKAISGVENFPLIKLS